MPRAENPSTTEIREAREHEWWQRLGLIASDPVANSVNDRRAQAAKDRMLRTHRPVLFAVEMEDGTTAQRTLDQVVAELDRVEREVEDAIQDAARRREQRGREATASAYAAPDAEELVVEGEWAGFTRARAIAWCWNLYQYEPHGFVPPNSILRERRVRELESGGIPDGFGYADRARELEAGGMTPQQYRVTKEVQRAPTFSDEDVRFGHR